MKQTPFSAEKPLKDAEEQFHIEGFFNKFITDDDWSAVIKIYSLCETVLSHWIAEALNRPELATVFTRLPMGEQGFGKLSFLETLDLVSKDEIRFLEKLGNLRNALAHDVTNCNSFSLSAYVNLLDKNQFRSFVECCIGKETLKDFATDPYKFTKENPKKALALGAYGVLAAVTIRRIALEKRKALQAQKEKLWETFLRHNNSKKGE
jgi:hypothetical protein